MKYHLNFVHVSKNFRRDIPELHSCLTAKAQFLFHDQIKGFYLDSAKEILSCILFKINLIGLKLQFH